MSSRTRTRNRLYLVGVLPALLMLLVSGRIALLLQEESSGLSSFSAEQYDAARDGFAANQVLNPFEPWLAHFDEGTARHRGGDLGAAVTAYVDALDEDVPADWVCAVRNNLALAHEGIGDAAAETEGLVAAEEGWTTGRAVLGTCLGKDADPDSTAIDDRLAAKLEGRDPSAAPSPTDPPPPADTLEERQRQLEERDRRALEQRRLQQQRREAREDSEPEPGTEQSPQPAW
jgi:hypothetical protein